MAFGSWMKKIGDKVKAFGEKVRKGLETALPYIEKGTKFLAEKGGKFVEDVGNALDNDTLRTIGKGVTSFGKTSNQWVNRGNRFLGLKGDNNNND